MKVRYVAQCVTWLQNIVYACMQQRC